VGSEKDKRKHTRLAIKIPAKLTFGNNCSVEGMTHNLSFGGAYIALRDSADAHSGDACQLCLVLQGGPDPIEIQLTCEVVHVIDTGLGIRFLLSVSDDQQFRRPGKITGRTQPQSRA
jgi:hypothetical protein